MIEPSEIDITIVKPGCIYKASFCRMIYRHGYNLAMIFMTSGIIEIIDPCYIKPLNYGN